MQHRMNKYTIILREHGPYVCSCGRAAVYSVYTLMETSDGFESLDIEEYKKINEPGYHLCFRCGERDILTKDREFTVAPFELIHEF